MTYCYFSTCGQRTGCYKSCAFPIKMLDTKDVGDSEEDPTVAYQTLVPEFEDSLYYSDWRNGRRFAMIRKLGLVADFNYKLFESSLQYL